MTDKNSEFQIVTYNDMLTMTVNQAAKKIGCSYPSMVDICNRKGFPKLRLGRKILIPVKEFYQWLNSQCDE